MDVERVDLVELEDVDQVDPDELAALHDDRPVEVVEPDRVDRVDLVRLVEVRVEPVHHHHELVCLGARLLRIDDERAVEALGDVRRQRAGVAVVQMEPERVCGELVHGASAGLDQPGADARYAVHERRVDPVEVNRVRVRGRVQEPDPQQLALVGAQRRAGHATVVRPAGVGDARGDLELLVVRDQLPLAQDAAARQPCRPPPVEVADDLTRVEAVDLRIDDPGAGETRRAPSRRAGRECAPRDRASRASRCPGRGPTRGPHRWHRRSRGRRAGTGRGAWSVSGCRLPFRPD